MKVFFALVFLLAVLSISAQGVEKTTVGWFDQVFSARNLKRSIEEEKRILENLRKAGQEGHDAPQQARAMIELAALHLHQLKDYERAMDWLVQSLMVEDSLGADREKVFTLVAMSRIFEEVGDHIKSSDFLHQARGLVQDDDYEMLGFVSREDGRVQASLGNIDEAFEDYRQMLQYARSIDSRNSEGDALFAIGHLYSRRKEYENALKSHKEALAIRRGLRDKKKEAKSLNDIGELYVLMKNDERAMANHTAALEIRQDQKDKAGLAESYNNIAALYISKKDFKRAIQNLDIALSDGREAQNQEQILRAHELLSQCYQQLGDYRQALVQKEMIIGIGELIQQEKNERQLLELQNRYVLEKKETEIDQLETDKAQREKVIAAQQEVQRILIIVIVIGAIVGVLILYLYFFIRKTNRKLTEINATKDKLFSIIGHDLKGPLNSLTAFSSLLINHADSLTKDEIRMLSTDLDKSLKNLFALLENLLEWGRSQSGNIDFTPESFDLSTILKENQELLTGQAQNKEIRLVNTATGAIAVLAHKNSITTVVRNLISNAIKFTPKGGSVTVSTEDQGKFVKVNITDTGVGMSEAVLKKLFNIGSKHSTLGTSQEKGTGLELILFKEFVEKNGGKISVVSEEGKGSTFYFTIPRV